MGVLLCAALVFVTWVAFVFSKYNPDRKMASDKALCPGCAPRWLYRFARPCCVMLLSAFGMGEFVDSPLSLPSSFKQAPDNLRDENCDD